MELMTIKQYANDKHVSYESIRQQVKRYSKELTGHITVKNRTQYLDSDAVAFLNERRAEQPVIVVSQAREERISELEQQNKELTATIVKLQQEIIKRDEEYKTASKTIQELQQREIQLLSDSKTTKQGFFKRLFGGGRGDKGATFTAGDNPTE